MSYSTQGNAYPTITNEGTLPTISPMPSYTIKCLNGGHLDTKLNTVETIEKEFGGGGQIVYDEQVAFKGSYQPPKFIVQDILNGEDYAADYSFSKFWYGTNNSGYYPVKIITCDRNSESFYVFLVDSGASTSTYAYTIPKISKTDSSPLSRTLIKASFTVDAAVYVNDNLILLMDIISSPKKGIAFYSIDAETGADAGFNYENFTPDIFNKITSGTISNIAAYSDKQGSVYLAITLNPVNTYDRNVVFAKSDNYGNTWNFIYEPGTVQLKTIGNPLSEWGLDPNDSSTGQGYFVEKIYYDTINEEFILLAAGGTTSGWRTIALHSKDFFNWEVLNYPVYKNTVAESSSIDFEVASGAQFFRLNTMYCSILNNYTTNSGNFISIFENENELYGSREGLFWSFVYPNANKGMQTVFADIFEENGIVYYVASFYTSGFAMAGFNVHMLGCPTNICFPRVYNGAYFGQTNYPYNNLGWTKGTSGSPTEAISDDGLRIYAPTGTALFYYRSDLSSSNAYDYFRFIVKPVSSSGLTTATAQGIRFHTSCGNTDWITDVTVLISDGYIRIIDNFGSSGTTYPTTATGDFIELLVTFAPDDDENCVVAVYFKSTTQDSKDTWEFVGEEYVTGSESPGANREIIFGATAVTSSNLDYYWKAIYINDRQDANDNFRIENIQSNFVYNFNSLSLNRMMPDGIKQYLIDDIYVEWHGYDAIEEDTWSFDIDSDFSKRNILMKKVDYVWKSAFGVASGISPSSYSYLILDANEDNIGGYAFNTFVLKNINFKRFRIQANTTNDFSSPPYDQVVDMMYDSSIGIVGDNERINDDILTFQVSRFNNTDIGWIPGLLKGKYAILEKLWEEDLVGSSDNVYKSVAFKIMDNTEDTLTISTKGLVNNEAGGGSTYSPLKTEDGDNVIIYDTSYSYFDDTLRFYRYVQIKIDASNSYSNDLSGTSQPNLPNERCWQIGEFDIGVRFECDEYPIYGYSIKEDEFVNVSEEDDGRILAQSQGDELHTFELTYDLLPGTTEYIGMLAMVETLDRESRFWYLPNQTEDPFEVYLVIVDGDINVERIVTDGSEEYYRFTLRLLEVR